ncbi:MAG: Holliday junction resolvase RuvX [Alphaproteobacteria bacterium]|nr:Holliday junction resolvase RuvX [Alphaproteobacteria bacterium]
MDFYKPHQPPIPPSGRVLGLDVGAKRVGVALSDSAQTTALPKTPLPRRWQELKAGIVALAPAGVVLGEPRHMSGAAGKEVQSVADLAALIAKELNLPVALMDERLTSHAAEAAFFEQRLAGSRQTRASKAESVGQVDSAAAALLLQTWLEARRNGR